MEQRRNTHDLVEFISTGAFFLINIIWAFTATVPFRCWNRKRSIQIATKPKGSHFPLVQNGLFRILWILISCKKETLPLLAVVLYWRCIMGRRDMIRRAWFRNHFWWLCSKLYSLRFRPPINQTVVFLQGSAFTWKVNTLLLNWKGLCKSARKIAFI